MAKDLKVRYPKYGAEDKVMAFCNFLHPGLKGTVMYTIGMYNTTIERLIIEEEGPPEDVGLNQALVEDSDDEEQMLLNELAQGMATVAAPHAESPMQREINQYRALPMLGKNADVLVFWKDNAKNFPLLSKVVRKYFCIQATSTSSERTFSTGGAIVTPKRNKLDPLNVHMLVYLRENLGKVTMDTKVLDDPIAEAEEAEILKELPNA